MTTLPTEYLEPVQVIRIINPFEPACHIKYSTPWQQLRSVNEYVADLEDGEWVVSLDGVIVPAENYATTYPSRGSYVVVCPILEGGGGGGKSILRFVAMIAVIAFAYWAAPYLAPVGADPFTIKMITAGITIAGTMLVNAILPMAMPKQKDFDNSPTYGIDGPKNTSMEGLPVPICYGKHRMAGNRIHLHTVNVSRKNQDLYLMFCAGEGPIAGISEVMLNDQPLEGYRDWEAEYRFGNPDQTPIGWFDDVVTPFNVNSVLVEGQYINYVTTEPVDKLRFDLLFPLGLYRMDSDGDIRSKSATFTIEIRKMGDVDWISLSRTGVYQMLYVIDSYQETYCNGENCSVETVPQATYANLPQGYSLGGVEGRILNSQGILVESRSILAGNRPVGHTIIDYSYGGEFNYTASWTTPSRISIESRVLESAIYECRLTRTNQEFQGTKDFNKITLTDVNEIQTEDVAYRNTALVAIKIRLSDQLAGLPNVTYINHGKVIRTFDWTVNSGSPWVSMSSSNPAWVCLDILTNTRYGAGIPDSRIDLEAFKDWALHCDLIGLEFNGVIDQQMNLWDAMRPVLRAGHAQLVPQGTRYSVVIEKASSPTMMFSVSNIVEKTLSIDWLPMSERANAVEAKYFDAADDYKQTTVKLYDPEVTNSTQEKVATVDLIGITNRERALKECRLHLNLNKYVTQTATFDAPLEAIACQIGDLIYIQHDMPQWGHSGRMRAGSTTSSLNIDRKVILYSGKSYRILVHYPNILRYSGTVESVVGNNVFVNGYDGTATGIKRFKVGTIDREIIAVVGPDGGGFYGVTLEDVSGISATNAYEIHDTDVMEERDIVNTVNETDVLTTVTPLSTAPGIFANWMFGETTKYKKPFRVRSISGDDPYTRTISALEYNASVYDETIPVVDTPNYSDLITIPEHSTIDQVTEALVKSAGTITTKVHVHFNNDSTLYSHSNVFVSVDESPEELLGTGRTIVTYTGASDGVSLTFRVVAVDVLGSSPPYSNAPTITHVVVGKTAPPAAPTGLVASVVYGGVDLKWNANTEVDVVGYEIREGNSWDAGTVIATNHQSTTILVPNESIGTFTYRVRAIDVVGNYSETGATIQVTIAPPADVQRFAIIQNGSLLNLRWDKNPEIGIMGYEIREGGSWATGVHIATVYTDNYIVPHDNTGSSRTFWIRAKAIPGIYSTNPVFYTISTKKNPDRNVIVTSDQHAAGYTDVKYKMQVLNQNLTLADNETYGEYIFDVDLGATIRAHNYLTLDFDAIIQDTTQWSTATYPWSDPLAERTWTLSGDEGAIGLTKEMSTYVGLTGSLIEGWSLNDTLTGVGSTAPNQSANATYQTGRFNNGLYVDADTIVDWTYSVPSEFSISFWIMPKVLATGRKYVYWGATNGLTSKKIEIAYEDGNLTASDSDGNTLTLPFTMNVDDQYLVALSQTTTTRRLMVGELGGQTAYAEDAFASVGGYTDVALYPVLP